MTTDTCPFAPDHPRFDQRLTTLEREMGEARRHRESDGAEWGTFLVQFGHLQAQLAGLKGQLAGYLLAGSVLAAGVGILASRLIHP